jgi:GAF domain-containing protein
VAANPFVREVLAHKRPIVLSDVHSDSRVSKETAQTLHFRSMLVLPMELYRHTLGLVFLGSVEGYRIFTREEVELTTGVANAIVLAIEQVRLFEELHLKLHKSELQRETAETMLGDSPGQVARIRL